MNSDHNSNEKLTDETEFILNTVNLEKSEILNSNQLSHDITNNFILNEKKFNQSRKIHSSPSKTSARRYSHDSQNGSARARNSLCVSSSEN